MRDREKDKGSKDHYVKKQRSNNKQTIEFTKNKVNTLLSVKIQIIVNHNDQINSYNMLKSDNKQKIFTVYIYGQIYFGY